MLVSDRLASNAETGKILELKQIVRIDGLGQLVAIWHLSCF
jgi:hypothetical protein